MTTSHSDAPCAPPATARRTIVALDPTTGNEVWKYEIEKGGAPNRGVSYWPGDTRSPARILAGTTDGRLLALDAETGKLIPTFGENGAINLRVGVADKVRFEIAVSEEFVDPAIDALCSAGQTGEVGDGKIFVLDLEQVVRIRSGETEEAAVTPVASR